MTVTVMVMAEDTGGRALPVFGLAWCKQQVPSEKLERFSRVSGHLTNPKLSQCR